MTWKCLEFRITSKYFQMIPNDFQVLPSATWNFYTRTELPLSNEFLFFEIQSFIDQTACSNKLNNSRYSALWKFVCTCRLIYETMYLKKKIAIHCLYLHYENNFVKNIFKQMLHHNLTAYFLKSVDTVCMT
jgi:hypothetical protein